jgi:hypothetical protein
MLVKHEVEKTGYFVCPLKRKPEEEQEKPME